MTTPQSKVVHLTTVHSASDTRVFRKEARTLARTGYDVTLIAPFNGVTVMDGVTITGLPTPKTRFARMVGLPWRALRVAVNERASVYHLHDPELLPIGLLIKGFTGARIIYDVHEDVPRQILNKRWIPSWLRRVVAWLSESVEEGAARLVDGIVPATPAIALRFPPEKTAVVQNFPIATEFEVPGGVPYVERSATLAYIGGITERRGIVELIRALEVIPATYNVSLILAGRFSPPALEERVREMPGWRRVRFVGWRTQPEVAGLLGNARVGVVTLHPTPNYVEARPVKLFEYMAAGVPVVASDFPGWRQVVEQAGCGLLVDPLDPEAIGAAIAWLLDHPEEAESMGERGRLAVRERYNWEQQAERLLNLYRRLL